MKEIIAMHGWGSDSSYWKAWENHFQNHDWSWQSGDRGYGELPFKIPTWYTEPRDNPSGKNVLIAHSLGPHLIDQQIISEATDIVLLASFSSFLPKSMDNRALEIALKGMQSNLGTNNESKMFKKFLKRTYYPEKIKSIPEGPFQKGLTKSGRERLEKDLNLLIETNSLPNGLSPKARILVIEAEKDAIVSPEARKILIQDLSKHLEIDHHHWVIPKKGHALNVNELIERVHHWLECSQ